MVRFTPALNSSTLPPRTHSHKSTTPLTHSPHPLLANPHPGIPVILVGASRFTAFAKPWVKSSGRLNARRFLRYVCRVYVCELGGVWCVVCVMAYVRVICVGGS